MTSKLHFFSTCHRHPTIPLTGFCAPCLRERLAGIESSSTAANDQPSEDLTLRPEHRRTKSFSVSGAAHSAAASSSEPRRRSCEVRARNSLCDLFNLDDGKKGLNRKFQVESEKLGFEIREEEIRNTNEAIRVSEDGSDGSDEVEGETKTMKEFIDLELQSRKNVGRDLKEIAGSFWDAASMVSKKLGKWKWKQKLKKKHGSGCNGGGVNLMGTKVEKPRVRLLRENQTENGEYGFGRRSCDIDGRFSMDAGRISVDESRLSFDGPRASWDGYLIGNSCPKFSPMISVVEKANFPVSGVDERVLVEEKVNLESALGDPSPGGSLQTKDYYSYSLPWQRRRRSFDGSNSHGKPAMAEIDELKLIPNAKAKVSPTTTRELFYGAKLHITEKDLNLKSSRNVGSDYVMGSDSKGASEVAAGVNQKGFDKFHKWLKVWNKLGLVQRREENLGEEFGAKDMVNKLRRVVNVQAKDSVSQKLIRSYSVSCGNPCRMAGLIDGLGGPDNGRREHMLQRNRSVRYSPNNLDTGLLRFYLAPLKSCRRSKSKKSSLSIQ